MREGGRRLTPGSIWVRGGARIGQWLLLDQARTEGSDKVRGVSSHSGPTSWLQDVWAWKMSPEYSDRLLQLPLAT